MDKTLLEYLHTQGQKMKIAIFCDYLHSFGGTEYYNATLAMELKKRGCDVRVFICEKTQNQYWVERLTKAGIKTYEPERHRIDREDRSVDTEFVNGFIDEFISWSPDIIHASPAANLLTAFLSNKKAPRTPIVATEHTTPGPDSAFWYPDSFPRLMRRIDAFIATCKASANGIKQFHKFDGPVNIIPHFINTPHVRKTKRISNSVGCIARMSPEKGIGVLLVAWRAVVSKIPSAKLYLYGSGRVQSYFERLAMSLAIQNSVCFAGTFDPKDGPVAIAQQHDIFVQPSLFESIPTSIIELGLIGKPVIATNVGGVREIINKDTGVLIPSGSTDRLARSIISLLQDKKRQACLASNLKESMGQKYDMQSNIDKMIELYQSVVTKKSKK